METPDVRAEPGQAVAKARVFLEETAQCEEKRFPSIGHGTDCRFQKPGLAGTALVHENRVGHTAFFRLNDPSTINPQRSTDQASLRSRRRRFTQ